MVEESKDDDDLGKLTRSKALCWNEYGSGSLGVSCSVFSPRQVGWIVQFQEVRKVGALCRFRRGRGSF